MMKKQVLYLTDNWIYFYNYKVEKKYKASLPKGIVKNGKIADIEKFIIKYETILKENHLNGSILGDKLLIFVHMKYTKADIALLKSVFEKMNYRDIRVVYEDKFYDLNNDNVWINYNEGYLLLSYMNEASRIKSFLIEENFFDEEREMYEFIKRKVGVRDIYVIGNNKKIDKFYKEFELLFKNNTYIFTDSETYLLNHLIND